MKAIKLSSGKVRLSLNASEFEALQAIIEDGHGPAKKRVGGRGFSAFEGGILTTDAPKRPVPAGFAKKVA